MASRNTIQRTIIAEELRRLANHPTADDVYDAVHAEHPSIGKLRSTARSVNLPTKGRSVAFGLITAPIALIIGALSTITFVVPAVGAWMMS